MISTGWGQTGGPASLPDRFVDVYPVDEKDMIFGTATLETFKHNLNLSCALLFVQNLLLYGSERKIKYVEI